VEDQRGDLLPSEGLTSRWPAATGLLAVAALAAWMASRMWAVCRAQHGLPMWDEAAHGLAGVEVAEAIRRFDPLALLRAIHVQALWPFVHSLLLAPAFLTGGIVVASAEATSVALYAGTIVLLYLAGLRLHPARGPWIGLTAASLALLAPSYRVFGSLAFLEMPGAFLLTLAFLLHARSGEEPASVSRLRVAGCAATALFLCKYNYGGLWLLGVLGWEWEGASQEDRQRAWTALRALTRPSWWLRPVPALFAIGMAGIVAISLTGGTTFTLFGQRISAHSPGNLPYALWLLGLIWILLPRRRRASRAATAWASLPFRARELVLSVGVPLAIWFTLPGHLRELVHFAANRDSGTPLWTLDGLLLYPRALATDFSPVPWLGWAALALAAWPPARGRQVARLAWLALVIAFVATVLHRYRDNRFFFTVCPLLWLCAADRAAWLSQGLMRAMPARAGRLLWLVAGLAILAGAGVLAVEDPRWAERRASLRAPADVATALDAVLDQIDPASVDAVIASATWPPRSTYDASRRAVLLGYANGLSPGLLAWHARLTRPSFVLQRLPRRVPMLPENAGERALAARLSWLDANADVVISALADSGEADYVKEVAGDRLTTARLVAGDDGWVQRGNVRVGRFTIARFERGR
jgi:hypothetical protein